jgi:hypothetical protein
MAVDSQTSATTPAPETAPQGTPADAAPAVAAPSPAPASEQQSPEPAPPAGAEAPQAGFGSRGRLRRRARFLRKARELAYRDLGGLVFSLHRFGQRNDSLVLAKLATLGRIDAELRAIEDSLSERRPLTVLREAGITACPRCAAIHSSEDRFCPSCGLPLSRRSDLPIAGAAAGSPQPAAPPAAPAAGSPAATPTAPPAGRPASAFPSTVQQPVAPPAPASAAPQPGQPRPTPATQAFDAVRPAGDGSGTGRSPAPPRATPGEDDQPTEIIRPPAPGS